MVLARVCPWCRRTERWRQRCGCLPDGNGSMLVRHIPGVDVALAVHPYDEILRRFLLAAKNGGRRDLIGRLGTQLARSLNETPALPSGWPAARPTVVWVPASRHKRRRRGYDQGRLLARVVGHTLGLPVRPLLGRAGGESQEGRDRSERLAGPTLRCRTRHAPSVVVLIDDVITTGSSMAAAARALRHAGAHTIVAAAIASSGHPTNTAKGWPQGRSAAYGEEVTISTLQ